MDQASVLDLPMGERFLGLSESCSIHYLDISPVFVNYDEDSVFVTRGAMPPSRSVQTIDANPVIQKLRLDRTIRKSSDTTLRKLLLNASVPEFFGVIALTELSPNDVQSRCWRFGLQC